MKLSASFYKGRDVVLIARKLIGKVLVTFIEGQYTSGIITETEAYNGIYDKASHAYGDRRTMRTEVMYGGGGLAYVYLCYGIHSLFNVVTNVEGVPNAVLVRGVCPLDGTEIMEARRKRKTGKGFSDGPGTAAKALGIHYSQSGADLRGGMIWIEDRKIRVAEKDILVTPRIGVDYAAEDALFPYRFLWTKPCK